MNSPPRILLVDDLEQNLLALEALVGREDVAVRKARSGEEALEVLLVEDVALALVDVRMPGMDGFELAELMRGTERSGEILIILVTAVADDPRRIFKGYESGGVGFFFKPLDPYILQSKVRVFLQLYRQKQAMARHFAGISGRLSRSCARPTAARTTSWPCSRTAA